MGGHIANRIIQKEDSNPTLVRYMGMMDVWMFLLTSVTDQENGRTKEK